LNKIKTCANNCIFCFISQLPPGLRATLYIKDDDYLESYKHGNFITLTNLNKKDLEKIIKYRIEPLYISLHSFNEKIRNKLFGNTCNINAIDYLADLDKNRIKTNIQIVLCPGFNDGKDIENTLIRLMSDFKHILSIGIVPVGITKYNKINSLIGFDKKRILVLINSIKNFKDDKKYNGNSSKIFLSDEFYIMGGLNFPEYNSYGRFYQIQNGIGKSVDFLKQAENWFKKCKITGNNLKKRGSVLVITSEYGEVILKKLFKLIKDKLKSLEKRYNVSNVKILVVKNDFLGGNVKVTGLMAGKDIIESLKKENLEKFSKVLIPECIFNSEGNTIDNISKETIKSFNRKIKIIKENGLIFTKEIIQNSQL
jgi:putative radical SAM enzyme (TIGR03279 family)